jgi:hypothetical protein
MQMHYSNAQESGLETNFSACQSSRTDRLQFLPVCRKIIQSATYTENNEKIEQNKLPLACLV